jgi:hypothetical protein
MSVHLKLATPSLLLTDYHGCSDANSCGGGGDVAYLNG